MKKTLTFVSMLALAACGGGGDGGSLHPTHGTSTGGASNQPAYYANFKQYFDNVIKTGADGGTYSNFAESDKPWESHGGYKHYQYQEHSYTGNTSHVVDEKEMQLANYGVHSTRHNDAGLYVIPAAIEGYIHNREGVGANLYTPTSGTSFTGGTLAYLTGIDGVGGRLSYLIKGDATYVYNPSNPELTLAFDNYHTFNIVKNGAGYDVTVSGTNNGADVGLTSIYNITPGTYYAPREQADFSATHLQKGDIQEAAGVYEVKFGNNGIPDTVPAVTSDISITGAFGGTHE